MARTFTVVVACDVRESADCQREVSTTGDNPREFDLLAVELFQRGWVMGFKNTDLGPSATSDTLVPFDVCPACFEDAPGHTPPE